MSRLIDRRDLVAALEQAAGKRVTIISAPAGSGKTSLLHAWADRPGQNRRIAFLSVKRDQLDAEPFWLALLGEVRAATGGAEPPPAAPGFNGQAMVDKVVSELAAVGEPFVLVIDDLHELRSTDAADQLTAMLTKLRPGVHAIVATRAATGEIRNAAAVIRLAEQDPAGARRELRAVLDGTAPTNPHLTLVEAHLLDALASRDLGDEPASGTAVEQALRLAEPDRRLLPFAMTGAWHLLTVRPPQERSHAALVADILDTVHGGAPDHASPASAEALSPSELRVLRYLPTNLTRPEIAAQLSVSLNTVNTHIRRIYSKLGTTDRSLAVQRGRELRLLSTGRL